MGLSTGLGGGVLGTKACCPGTPRRGREAKEGCREGNREIGESLRTCDSFSRTSVDEVFQHIAVTILGSNTQRRDAKSVSQVDIASVVQQQSYDVFAALFGRFVHR